jgi:cell division control protein 45
MHNIPKIFDLERGGDTRCIIFDNHRPLHLANIYSRHSVVVFDDASEIENDSAYIPSDHSDAEDASESDEESSDSDGGEDEVRSEWTDQ